jgi:hypothetical protein
MDDNGEGTHIKSNQMASGSIPTHKIFYLLDNKTNKVATHLDLCSPKYKIK